MPDKSHDLYARLAPFLFVVIWATGFITAGYSAPYAEPLSILAVRFALAALALLVIALIARTAWPRDSRVIAHAMISGTLLHGGYLCGVWWAVRQGVPAGMSGIIAALQPILTALLAPMLVGERLSGRQWLGIFIGFAGLMAVISPKILAVDAAGLGAVAWPLIVNMLAMLAITLGTFYQKRFVTGHVFAVTFWQYIGAVLVSLPLALALESFHIVWNGTIALVVLWSVFGLSIGGILLLLGLIARGEVSRAATYIFLVPPASALMAYVLFGEQLNAIQLCGMVLTGVGVWLATRK